MRRFYRADATPLLYPGTKFDETGKSNEYYGWLNGVGRADHDPPTLRQYLSVLKKCAAKKGLIRRIVRSPVMGEPNGGQIDRVSAGEIDSLLHGMGYGALSSNADPKETG